MAKVSSPYTLPDDHVALIGRIAEAWAQLEFRIDLGIWHLSNTPQQLTACITSQFLSIHPRLKAFRALVMVRNGSQASVDSLNAFAGSISGLVERRNRSIHDPRYKQKDTAEIHRLEITAKPKVRFGFFPEPKEDLRRTLDQIYDKVAEFEAIRDRILDEIDKLPPESLPTLLQIYPVKKDKADQATNAQES